MQDSSDAELMLRFQRGDSAAFEQLFQRHKQVLFRFLVRLSSSTPTAEEVSQQTWLKVIDVARQGRYRKHEGVAFRTWLCTLARNHFLDEFKRKFAVARTQSLPDNMHETLTQERDPVLDPAVLVDRDVRAQHLRRALLTLPFEQREVIALWAAGVEVEAIARMVEAPRDTILSRKKYAISKLRQALAELDSEEHRA